MIARIYEHVLIAAQIEKRLRLVRSYGTIRAVGGTA